MSEAIHTIPDMLHGGSASKRRRPALRGLGCAVPAMQRAQHDAAEEMMRLWDLTGVARKRFERIVAGSGVEMRHGVALPKDIIGATTQRRMELYERFAPDVAERAARAAMVDGNVSPAAVTDLIVVSCTGFSAPGVDTELVRRLGLPADVHRTVIGFMGCFGAIIGLRHAMNVAAANPSATALVVCVELCSLHLRSDPGVQNQVASALFGDGAAAVIVQTDGDDIYQTSGAGDCIGVLMPGRTQLIDSDRELMSWRVTDHGFAMTLDARVPAALGESLREYINAAVGQGQLPRGGFVAVHPGGPSIVDAVDDTLELNGEHGIDAARSILRRFGNMSSATVLFVLRELMANGHQVPGTLIAFGPGLTIESVGLRGVL